MVEVEILRNNWGEKKWSKFVEKSKKESVKAFFVFEEFNSRVIYNFEFPDHMISTSVTLETNGKCTVAIISITSKQMANH